MSKSMWQDEAEIRLIAATIAAGIQELHEKGICLGVLTPWVIKLDKYGVIYFDLIWCVTREYKYLEPEYLDSKQRQYLGSLSLVSS